MNPSMVQQVMARRIRPGSAELVPDEVIVEEPLSIRLDGVLVSTTMRTPGDDLDLAAGFCFTEGLLGSAEIIAVHHCGTGPDVDAAFTAVNVDTLSAAPMPTPRLGPTSSSCGICGNDAIDALTDRLTPLTGYEPWDLALLASLPGRARPHQPLFDATGAVHMAAAFDRSGTLVVAREDIGRHNAVDKVVGHLLLSGRMGDEDRALFVSSRASFEMVQKAWAAGFTALVAVSGPSSLAVATARRSGLTLAGFVRDGRANIYSPDGA